MPTLSDYTSILEIGFGVNAAISYVYLFINPAIRKSEADITRFQWWVENPERLKSMVGRNLDLEEFEDALTNWIFTAERMNKAIERHQRFPIFCALLSAVILFAAFFFQDVVATNLILIGVSFLCFAPVILGSAYLWYRTSSERSAERAACQKANGLFIA